MGIIPGAFLWVGKDFVGGLNFSEPPCCFFFGTVVAVRMEVEGAATVGFLDSVIVLISEYEVFYAIHALIFCSLSFQS